MNERLGDKRKQGGRRHVYVGVSVFMTLMLLAVAATPSQAQLVKIDEQYVDVNFGEDSLNFTVRAAVTILNIWVKICVYGEVRSDLFKIDEIFSGGSTNVFDYTDTEVITDVWVKTGTTDDGGPGVHFPNGNAACPPPPGEEPEPGCAGPAEVTAEAVQHSVWVNWTAVNDTDSYRVYRGESEEGMTLLAETSGDSTTHQDGTVEGNTTYWYTVTAVIGGDETESCMTAEVTSHQASHLDPCDGPANLSAERTQDGSIDLSWDPVDNATAYNLYRAVGEGSEDYELIANTTSTNHTDTNVTENGTYRYQVAAFIENEGERGPCSTVEVRPAEEDDGDDGGDDHGDCNGPQTVQAMSSGEDIWVTWSAVNNSSEYTVYRAAGDGDFSELATVDGNNTEYRDDAVDPGVTYRYQVTATVDGNETEACSTAEATAIPNFPTVFAGLLASIAGLGAYVRSRRRV